MNGPYEIEQWEDKMTDKIFIKIRKVTEEGKLGIIIPITDLDLYELREGDVYPFKRLS